MSYLKRTRPHLPLWILQVWPRPLSIPPPFPFLTGLIKCHSAFRLHSSEGSGVAVCGGSISVCVCVCYPCILGGSKVLARNLRSKVQNWEKTFWSPNTFKYIFFKGPFYAKSKFSHNNTCLSPGRKPHPFLDWLAQLSLKVCAKNYGYENQPDCDVTRGTKKKKKPSQVVYNLPSGIRCLFSSLGPPLMPNTKQHSVGSEWSVWGRKQRAKCIVFSEELQTHWKLAGVKIMKDYVIFEVSYSFHWVKGHPLFGWVR